MKMTLTEVVESGLLDLAIIAAQDKPVTVVRPDIKAAYSEIEKYGERIASGCNVYPPYFIF